LTSASLTYNEKLELLALLNEKANRKKYNQFDGWFPEYGPLRRSLYPKHIAFFDAGIEHRERLFMAGNRVGKTIAGGYEATCHLTGIYPNWWKGRVFDRPVVGLAAGDTSATTRDIIQNKMLGSFDDIGSGMIPKHLIQGDPVRRQGIAEAYEEVRVKHISGGTSRFMLRSYEQGRKIFQGFELDFAWLDEEVPQDVYAEALIRTMTTSGLLMMTFTPLQGMTPLVVDFMESAGLL
jgi:phage terminase large subunit-like protein